MLAVLASAPKPLTSYRIARTFGGQKIKVSHELKRLEASGLVARVSSEKTKTAWALQDSDLRAFLRRRVRVTFESGWDRMPTGPSDAVGRLLAEIEASLPDPVLSREFYRPKGWKPSPEALRILREKVRSPQKDEILRKYGARTSPREGLRL